MCMCNVYVMCIYILCSYIHIHSRIHIYMLHTYGGECSGTSKRATRCLRRSHGPSAFRCAGRRRRLRARIELLGLWLRTAAPPAALSTESEIAGPARRGRRSCANHSASGLVLHLNPAICISHLGMQME